MSVQSILNMIRGETVQSFTVGKKKIVPTVNITMEGITFTLKGRLENDTAQSTLELILAQDAKKPIVLTFPPIAQGEDIDKDNVKRKEPYTVAQCASFYAARQGLAYSASKIETPAHKRSTRKSAAEKRSTRKSAAEKRAETIIPQPSTNGTTV